MILGILDKLSHYSLLKKDLRKAIEFLSRQNLDLLHAGR